MINVKIWDGARGGGGGCMTRHSVALSRNGQVPFKHHSHSGAARALVTGVKLVIEGPPGRMCPPPKKNNEN